MMGRPRIFVTTATKRDPSLPLRDYGFLMFLEEQLRWRWHGVLRVRHRQLGEKMHKFSLAMMLAHWLERQEKARREDSESDCAVHWEIKRDPYYGQVRVHKYCNVIKDGPFPSKTVKRATLGHPGAHVWRVPNEPYSLECLFSTVSGSGLFARVWRAIPPAFLDPLNPSHGKMNTNRHHNDHGHPLISRNNKALIQRRVLDGVPSMKMAMAVLQDLRSFCNPL